MLLAGQLEHTEPVETQVTDQQQHRTDLESTLYTLATSAKEEIPCAIQAGIRGCPHEHWLGKGLTQPSKSYYPCASANHITALCLGYTHKMGMGRSTVRASE